MEKEGVAHTSARNKLRGVITAIKRGDVMCQVEMRVGDNHVVAVITTEAADEMGLQVGMEAVAMFKSTSVMIAAPTGDNGSGSGL
jgi:molybdopterin-binding protein